MTVSLSEQPIFSVGTEKVFGELIIRLFRTERQTHLLYPFNCLNYPMSDVYLNCLSKSAHLLPKFKEL